MVEASAQAGQFMQMLKCKRKNTNLYYKNPKLQKFDEVLAKKLFQRENPGLDLEQIRHIIENLLYLKVKQILMLF